MSAFIPSTAVSAFTARTRQNDVLTTLTNNHSKQTQTATTRMGASIPDPTGPNTTKYLQFIPADRLNKAPIITLNSFKDPHYNSVSVSMPQLPTDLAAGENLKIGVDTFISSEPAPPSSKYSKFYNLDTIHQAPCVSITYSGEDSHTRPAVCISMTGTPLRVGEARNLLETVGGAGIAPDPKLYEPFLEANRLNVAPVVKADRVDSFLEVENVNMPLNLYAANMILEKYRS